MTTVLVGLVSCIGNAVVLGSNFREPREDVKSIHFYDWTGQETDHLQFVVNDTATIYNVVPDAVGTDWEITPALPEGLYFSKYGPLIGNYGSGEVTSQQFTIQLSKRGVLVANSTFYLEVVPCTSGVVYTIEQGKGSYVMEIRQNSQLLRNVTISGGKTMCLPPGTLDVTTRCYGQVVDACLLQIIDPVGLVLQRVVFTSQQSESFAIDPQPKAAPSFGDFNKDFYALYKGIQSFSIPIVGAHYPVEFNPPLPEGFSWSSLYQHVNIYADRGSYKFTVTIHNALGKASTEIGIYVDACPENLYLLAPRASLTNQENITVTDSQKRVVMQEYMNGELEANTCVPAGDYDVTITMLEEKAVSDYILSFMAENGDYMESFIRNKGLATDVHRITLGDVVPFGSSFKFLLANSVRAKWTQRKFSDRSWKEGVSGHWGSFASSASSAFFRRQFSVKDLSAVSVVQVAVEAVGDVTLYLNGVMLRQYSSVNASRIHTTAPGTFLTKGDNVICVEVHGSPSETVVFDLSVHLSRSSLLHPPHVGVASDHPEQEETSYRAVYAFQTQQFSSYYWRSAAIPVNLTFFFTDLHRSWINRITFTPSNNDQPPTDFEIDGLITAQQGNETVVKEFDTLGHIVNPSFGFTHRYYDFDFTPKRVYDGFRFRFHKGYANDSIEMRFISFHMRSSLRCKRTGSYKSSLLGERRTGRCPLKQMGYRSMRCVPDEEGKPVWQRDDSMCVARFAPRDVAFVDTTIVVKPLGDVWLDTFYDYMRPIVTKNLTVWEDQVSFPMVRFLDETEAQCEILMRFTVEEEIGAYVVKKLKEEMEKQLANKMTRIRPCEIHLDRNPTCRSPFPFYIMWWVVLVVLLLVVTNILTFFCTLSFRSPKGEKQERRRLRKQALLDHQALV